MLQPAELAPRSRPPAMLVAELDFASEEPTSTTEPHAWGPESWSAGARRSHDYLHARFRSPVYARFLRVDPSQRGQEPKRPQSWNRYTYAYDNPLKYIDPNGQESVAALGAEYRIISEELGPAALQQYQQSQARGAGIASGIVLASGFAANAPGLALSLQGLYLNPRVQLAFSNVAAGLAEQGVPVARFGAVTKGAAAFTPGQLASFERQVSSAGIGSLLRSRQSLQGRLGAHLQKLDEVTRAGGFTSSVETEIVNFSQQINAIDEILRRGGLFFFQGELFRLQPR